MHALWNHVAGWQPHRVVSRLFLRECFSFEGSPEDEAAVHAVARILVHDFGFNPFTHASRAGHPADMADEPKQKQQSSLELNHLLHRGIREHRMCRERWRTMACPSTLLPRAEAAVRQAVRLGVRGSLGPLPTFAENVCVIHKEWTGSKRRVMIVVGSMPSAATCLVYGSPWTITHCLLPILRIAPGRCRRVPCSSGFGQRMAGSGAATGRLFSQAPLNT